MIILVSETSFIDLTKRNVSEDRNSPFVAPSPTEDDVRIYTFEGGGSDTGSLSSLSICKLLPNKLTLMYFGKLNDYNIQFDYLKWEKLVLIKVFK